MILNFELVMIIKFGSCVFFVRIYILSCVSLMWFFNFQFMMINDFEKLAMTLDL